VPCGLVCCVVRAGCVMLLRDRECVLSVMLGSLCSSQLSEVVEAERAVR